MNGIPLIEVEAIKRIIEETKDGLMLSNPYAESTECAVSKLNDALQVAIFALEKYDAKIRLPF
jgi:hypothetical protein